MDCGGLDPVQDSAKCRVSILGNAPRVVQFGDSVEGDLRLLHFPRSKQLRFFVAHQCPIRHDLRRILAAEFPAESDKSLAEPLHRGKRKQRLAPIPRNIEALGSGIELAAHEPHDVGFNRGTHAPRVSVQLKAIEAIEIAGHRRRDEQLEPFAALSSLLMRGHYFR